MENTLYKRDTLNNIRVYSVRVSEKNNVLGYEITTGIKDGALVSTFKAVNSGKNIGKSNETSVQKQIELEMQSRIADKIKESYVRDILDLKTSGTLGSGIKSPMLAQKHHVTGLQKGSKTLKQIGILGKEIAVQPKLDGNRCLIKIDNNEVKMYTRSGDVMPVQLKHIINDISKTMLKELIQQPVVLDGELFSEKFSFNRLNGLIKKEKATDLETEERLKIKYHIYDVMLNLGYKDRFGFISKFASENIIVIPSFEIIATDENVKFYLEKFLAEGNEGLMIRQLDMPYEHKRTWQLCKVKVFEDCEYKLVGFEEDSRGGFVGSFIMEMQNGERFNAGASGQSEEDRAYMWNHKNEFIGKMATICYFGVSEYGVPRFPKFKG